MMRKNMGVLVVMATVCSVGQNVQAMDKPQEKVQLVQDAQSDMYPSNLFKACHVGDFPLAIELTKIAPKSEVFRRNVLGAMPIYFALSGSPYCVNEEEKIGIQKRLEQRRELVKCYINRAGDEAYTFVCNDLWHRLVEIGQINDVELVTMAITVVQERAQNHRVVDFVSGYVWDLISSTKKGRDQLDMAIITESFDIAKLLLEKVGLCDAKSWALKAFNKSKADHYDSEAKDKFLLQYIK